jgi:hypothetical protein
MLHMSFPLCEIEIVGSQIFCGMNPKGPLKCKKLIKMSRDAGVESS